MTHHQSCHLALLDLSGLYRLSPLLLPLPQLGQSLLLPQSGQLLRLLPADQADRHFLSGLYHLYLLCRLEYPVGLSHP